MQGQDLPRQLGRQWCGLACVELARDPALYDGGTNADHDQRHESVPTHVNRNVSIRRGVREGEGGERERRRGEPFVLSKRLFGFIINKGVI